MKVVIAGGGTAGHVNPALALAQALGDSEVLFVGTATGAEAALVPPAGYRLETLSVAGFDRARPLALPRVAARALGATVRAGGLLRRLRPSVVVGMGGYVSLPVGLAASALRIPLVIHEQNIVLGLANKVLRRRARVVAVSFEQTLEQAGARGRLTGNPVAPRLAAFDPEGERARALERFDLDDSRRTLLVFGGSQGARRINQAAMRLPELWAGNKSRQIVHITGTAQAATPVGTFEDPIYRSVPFVEEMTQAYAVADLALCRGGATTVAELTAVGLPSVIVPYPYHRDQQQLKQGRVLEHAGAARVVLDADAGPEQLARVTGELLDAPADLQRMSAAARALGRPDAARTLAGLVQDAAG